MQKEFLNRDACFVFCVLGSFLSHAYFSLGYAVVMFISNHSFVFPVFRLNIVHNQWNVLSCRRYVLLWNFADFKKKKLLLEYYLKS